MFREDCLLTNETGKRLYESYAKTLPIIDYHCHLLPQEIYENRQFMDLGEMWLAHDHYKWRAMRTFGIDERYITGNASYHKKYIKFAEIMPELIGNPLYIWCALELKCYFGIEEPLCKENAEEIYQKTKAVIEEKHMTPRYCMKASNVEVVCTTEDPLDDLCCHRKLEAEGCEGIKVWSAFRPDKAFYAEKNGFSDYIDCLSQTAQMDISSFQSLMQALEKRLEYFAEIGTMISDNGIEDFTWRDYSVQEIEDIFAKAVGGKPLSQTEIEQYRSCFLMEIARIYHRHHFVMQLHIGTYQGANKSRELQIGAACGFDCTDDGTRIKSVGELLDQLTKADALPKTILYPLDARNIENYAILAAGFCE